MGSSKTAGRLVRPGDTLCPADLQFSRGLQQAVVPTTPPPLSSPSLCAAEFCRVNAYSSTCPWSHPLAQLLLLLLLGLLVCFGSVPRGTW